MNYLTHIIGAIIIVGATAAQSETVEEFVPSEPRTISAMLDLAQVGPLDKVYDLGSGDGRIVIAAAKRGATAIGIEINPKLVALSRQNIKAAHLSNARIIQADLFGTSVHSATVVTLFFGEHATSMIAPKLQRELTRGARIVSNGTISKNLGPPFRVVHIGQILCNGGICNEAPLYLWIMGVAR